MSDVPRWLAADSEASDELRRILGSAASDEPNDAELARLGERLAPLVNPPAGSPPASPRTLSLRLRLGVGVGVLGAVGVLLSSLANRPPSVLHTGLSELPHVALPHPTAKADDEAPLAVTSLAELPPEHATAPAPTPSASASKESEIEMLERAQAALRSGRAADALGITLEHARAYPRGALSQEREVIAVEALSRMGRRAEADARGKAFIQRFPNSSYARRIQTILGLADGGS